MIRVSQKGVFVIVSFRKEVYGKTFVIDALVEYASAAWHLVERDDAACLNARWNELPIHNMSASVFIGMVRIVLAIPSCIF